MSDVFPKPFALLKNQCEPVVQNLEPLFNSLIKTYYKLIELGLTKVNGKVTFINNKN